LSKTIFPKVIFSHLQWQPCEQEVNQLECLTLSIAVHNLLRISEFQEISSKIPSSFSIASDKLLEKRVAKAGGLAREVVLQRFTIRVDNCVRVVSIYEGSHHVHAAQAYRGYIIR
jgi:hypothetical protein